MHTIKNFSPYMMFRWAWKHILWLSLWMGSVAFIYEYFDIYWLKIPWLPLSLVGIAVAFYIGFKNNNAYDRMWEARKIWGAVVNSSRSWGATVMSFIGNQFTEIDLSDEEIRKQHKMMIYRHLGWLYALRSQLLVITEWEHANQGGLVGFTANKFREKLGIGLVNDEVTKISLNEFLCFDNEGEMINYTNTATQIIKKQSKELERLRKENLIDDFRHMELQKILQDFYTQQGKLERIKKFPLPRQYASIGSYFVYIFIFLLPFGVISTFSELGDAGIYLAVPFSVLIGWIFFTMEMIGDYSENPFQGMANDIPMLSLCRTIEIDLKEMLGEEDIPDPIKSKYGVLM